MIGISKYLINNKYLNMILLFSILIATFIQSSNDLNTVQLVIIFTLWILLIINDLLRSIIKKNKKNWHYFSLALSLILASVLKHLTNGLIVHYFYFYYVIEIVSIKNNKRVYFLFFHFILYLLILNFNLISPPVNLLIKKELLEILLINLLIYFSVIYWVYITYSIYIEKEEIRKLNKKLNKSNLKLQEYSQKVEELSIARERERMAQELHDSLGHSLIALILHLEFAEKTFASNPEKAQKVIVKARDIAKSSTSDLRKAVNALNEDHYIESLKNSINELIDNFSTLSDIKINLKMDEDLETLNPDLKLCIYKTVRESLTNGVKHGRATKFNLLLLIEKDNVILISKDNGIGCDKITMSNGLEGIEDRITALGGSVNFTTSKNEGFETKAKIPIYQKDEIITQNNIFEYSYKEGRTIK